MIASYSQVMPSMGEQGTALSRKPHLIRPPNLYTAAQNDAMALRFPDEAIGYPPLLSGRLLCRIVGMVFRESTFYEVG